MTRTILIDLDDTLLGNDMETFLPAYLGALGNHIRDYAPPEKMAQTMISATRKMFENTRPDRTLKESFDPHFYPPLEINQQASLAVFEQFYADVFPSLKGTTQFRPEAVDFVDTALARGDQIGIATNPLFPLTAILQRLEWAGLSPEKYPFSLIPCYETFHFAKPNPAFFAEFLTRLGWPEGPILMIGNDLDHDIRGAQGLGLPAFWITNGRDRIPGGQPTPNGRGELQDFWPWLDSLNQADLQANFDSHSTMIAILRGSSAALRGTLSEISSTVWTERPQPNEWSLTEIVCHLRDVEQEVNLPRLQKTLREDNPFISGVDSDAWAEPRQYIRQDGPQALQDFIATRIEVLDLLDNLGNAAWNRPIRHAIFGPTDLKEIVRIMAGHERLHGQQIFEVLENHKQRNLL